MKKAIVIGAGIAGTSAAYFLSRNGFQVTILEKEAQIASQASGNQVGILYPRIEAIWNNITEFYHHALNRLLTLIDSNHWNEACDFKQCGILILPHKEKDEERFRKINAYNKSEYVRLVTKDQATSIAGITIDKPCLYLPSSGMLNIPKLCQLMLQSPNIQVKLEHEVNHIKFHNHKWHLFSKTLIDTCEIVVIANAYAALKLLPSSCIEIDMVRGQVNYVPEIAHRLNSILCYGGYFTPAHNGFHHIGATFDKHSLSLQVERDSSHKNLLQLQKHFPNLLEYELADNLNGRAGIRAYSKDKLPVVGLCPNPEFYHGRVSEPSFTGLYLSTCHGSRGILSAISSAEMLANQVSAESQGLIYQNQAYQLLNPSRFLLRNISKTKPLHQSK